MVNKILNLLDFLPGLKTNSGAAIALVGYLLTFIGVNQVYVEPVKILAAALIAFGLAMKGLRGTPLMTAPPAEAKKG